MKTQPVKKRISREQWLSKGLELFALHGAEGLRVERLAKALNIAKSGFYCHFADRDDLLKHILDYWSHEYTDVITENPLLSASKPRERIRLAMTMIFEQNLAEYDAAIDLWARTDRQVARQRRKVIDKRLSFFRTALSELGFEGNELEMRTRVFVLFQMGERQILGPDSKASDQYRELRLNMLLGEPA